MAAALGFMGRDDEALALYRQILPGNQATHNLEIIQSARGTPPGNMPASAENSEGKLKGIMDYTEDDVVSVDFNHYPASATVDSKMTKVLENNFAKIIAWYDNEWGYSCRVVDLIEYMVKKGL